MKVYCVKLQDNEQEKVKGSRRVKMLLGGKCICSFFLKLIIYFLYSSDLMSH